MKTLLKILLLSLILNSTTACSQTNSKKQTAMANDNDKSGVLEVTRNLTKLMIERNTTEIEKIVDDNFTLTHITGYVQPKEEWFAEIERESMKYYSAKEVKHEIKVNGNKAEFMNQNLLDARIWGSRNTWRLQQRMQLEKRNGKWIILKSVATTF